LFKTLICFDLYIYLQVQDKSHVKVACY